MSQAAARCFLPVCVASVLLWLIIHDMTAYVKTKIHRLECGVPLPAKFTNPFDYVPHGLCVAAAGEVAAYVASRPGIEADARRGKMFGVLVVKAADGATGYLAAFSGLLAGSNDHDFFVPPVYDATRPDGYFKRREAEITALNRGIDDILEGGEYKAAVKRVAECREANSRREACYREMMRLAKLRRDEIRSRPGGLKPAEGEALLNESRHMKAELKRLRARLRAEEDAAAAPLRALERRVGDMKARRKSMSDGLQRWLFDRYSMLDATGNRRSLVDIFADTPFGVPPSGAGDCCAPKLLQYAYANGLRPVAMAEFWYGESPHGEIRHHLRFYPSCRGKCLPILSHMLRGLDVEEGCRGRGVVQPLEVVYEDEWLVVVNKPSGMMSVRGLDDGAVSVQSVAEERYGSGARLVHRLDRDTSGLVMVALTADVYKDMQRMFAAREVGKCYVALLDGETLKPDRGVIDLPLYADPLDRPYQKVDCEKGKPSLTEYRVTARKNGFTRVELRPLTGRTHQLRLHCAHRLGLGCPIIGDSLYGNTVGRMCLHACRLEFVHPVTGKRMRFAVGTDMFAL